MDERKVRADKALNDARDFLLMGMRIRQDDGGDVIRRIQKIVDEDKSKEAVRDAVRIRLSTDDVDAFLLALCPLHNRIFYEGYGPYWLKHCQLVDDRDDETEFSFYNDLIDMYWTGAWQEWKRKGKWEVTIMLPPTAGLLQMAYREEKERLEEEMKR